MQETHNNWFLSKIHSTTLCPAKTGKHKYRNITAAYLTCDYPFSPDKESCYIFSTWKNCWEFLATYGVNFQSVTQSFLKTTVCSASLSYCIFMLLPSIFLRIYLTYILVRYILYTKVQLTGTNQKIYLK